MAIEVIETVHMTIKKQQIKIQQLYLVHFAKFVNYDINTVSQTNLMHRKE